MERNLKILVLEDDVLDVELISKTLDRAGMTFTITVVDEKNEFEAAINTCRYDVILADNSLPQFNAVNALRIIQQKKINTPFILVTGTVSEEFAVDMIHQGVDDYILKGNLKKLPSAVESAIAKRRSESEKTTAEKALRESEHHFRILFEQAADGIVICDTQGHFIDANTAACNMTGYTVTELQHMNLYDTFFAEDKEKQPVRKEELLSGKAVISERRVKRKDETYFYVEVSTKLLPDGRLQAIARDITYRKHLEEQLLREKLEHQKKLAQATLDSQEKERTGLGRELHDNISQILTSTKLLMHAGLQEEDIRVEMLERSIVSLSKGIEEVRKLSKSLVTPAAHELSLIESIRDLLETLQMTTSLNIEFEAVEGFDDRLDQRQEVALYRIVQEQLNNIIKHANAQTIHIDLRMVDDHVRLQISDDGKGFDVQAKRNGIGLSNMQGRAELLNGQFSIHSEPGKGSVVEVELPLDTGLQLKKDFIFS